MKVILAYIPVPHRGYKEFLERHSPFDALYLMGESLQAELPYLSKNLPALNAAEGALALTALGWSSVPAFVAEQETLGLIRPFGSTIIMPDEDISRAVAEKYLASYTVRYDKTFLRWDKQTSLRQKDPTPNCIISQTTFDREIMRKLDIEKERSEDFWRQVAAGVVRDGALVFSAYNTHVPSPALPYLIGDPRLNFSRGVHIELSTAAHAEQAIISACAREGIATKDADLYVTTFPCPPCAKAIAGAGFRRCYFRDGYSMLDAESVLASAGVELVLVQ